MTRKYKIIQCPNCGEIIYIPVNAPRNSCPRCKSKIALHEIFQRCTEVGLCPKEVQDAIDVLKAEGFLEKREATPCSPSKLISYR